MDRAGAQRMLAEAEAHVAGGERDIALQRVALAGLADPGEETRHALNLLAHLEAAQIILVFHRDQLRDELEKLP
jgi:hypothetical protein